MHNYQKKMKQKIPRYYLIFSIPLVSLITILVCYFIFNNKIQAAVENTPPTEQNCSYVIKRLKGYTYIRPLVYIQSRCQSESLFPVRDAVQQLIDGYKQAGVLTSASVYLRVFGHGDWVCINDTETYRPGSLLKVPELITFLRENELHPGLLDKMIKYDHIYQSNKSVVFTSKSIELGKSYSIRELLRFMIEYSDNNATILLNNCMDANQFKKTFTDLGLKEPSMQASDYPVTSKDYSLFFEELYNAGYLTIEDSENAVELLTKCNFKDGLMCGIPQDALIAHKFGEAGDNNIHELHEAAIIISGNKRYQITVMTKGKDLKQLSDVIKNISKIVYQKVK